MKTVPHSSEMVKGVLKLVEAHREAFGQERVYLRAMALVLGEMLAFCGHRVTDLLRALGCRQEDWTAWYRLFQQPQRFIESKAGALLLRQTLEHVAGDETYVVGIDTTGIARDSQKMEGTSWLKCPRNPPWKVSIHRGQRFLNGSWLTPLVSGFSRAIPLRFLPAFPEKAITRAHAPQKEHLAGLEFVRWVRQQLDEVGRQQQTVLCLADGSYDKPDFWCGLPRAVTALVRTAKNRGLCYFPRPYSGKGRRRLYGEPAPAPQAYLRHRSGWKTISVTVRGHSRHLVYRVEGPFLRRGMAAVPLMLICVRGQSWQRAHSRKHRLPVFYLVNAIQHNGLWLLPLPVERLLAWAWQRWELEVVHREVKSRFGLGDKQCFHPHAAVASVQWSAWVYALLMLTAYRIYGNAAPVPRHTAWQPHPRRFSLSTVLDQCRLELTTHTDFSWLFSRSTHNWLELESALFNFAFTLRFPSSSSPP
jgi:hypothetical protein